MSSDQQRRLFFFSTTDHGPKHSRAIAEIVPADTPGAAPPRGRAFPRVYLTSREPLPSGLVDPHKKQRAQSAEAPKKGTAKRGGAAAASSDHPRRALLGEPREHPPPPDSMRSALSATGVTNFTVEDSHLKLQPLFVCHQDGNSSRYYCSGATLSGKSFFNSLLAKSYLQMFPTRRVIIFSVDHEDPSYASLSKFGEIVRIPLDKPEMILEPPIELTELRGDEEGALVIFDDYITQDKAVNKALEKLKADCLNRGRHYGLSTLVERQVAFGGAETKADLTNSLGCVFFPQSGGRKAYLDFLERYMGCKRKDITQISREVGQSRWVCISRAVPLTIMHERGVFLLNDLLEGSSD